MGTPKFTMPGKAKKEMKSPKPCPLCYSPMRLVAPDQWECPNWLMHEVNRLQKELP